MERDLFYFTGFERSCFVFERYFLSSNRFSIALLGIRVFFLLGLCLSAAAINSAIRRNAASRFAVWERYCWLET